MSTLSRFSLPTFLEALQSILADGLQHHETWLLRLLLSPPCKAFVDERCNTVQYVDGLIVCALTNGLCCLQGPTSNKDGESTKELLFLGFQQIIAPLEGIT